MRRNLFKRRYRDYEINPDEILIDDANVSRMNTQQFEGVFQKRISQKTLFFVGVFFILVFVIFSGRLISLQLARGETYKELAENNRLRQSPIFAERGVIYDRNGVEIAWNDAREGYDFSYRSYTEMEGLGHLLGYVYYPEKDSSGFYWRNEIGGQAGLEKKYNDLLSGQNGAQLIEVDATNNLINDSKMTEPVNGINLTTSVDAKIQHYLFKGIQEQAEEAGFTGGAGSIMDIETGELLAFTSYPEFDPYTLAEGSDTQAINGFFNDPQKPFLNRVLSGVYSPGSTVKPFLGLAALNENLINDSTRILSTGRIEIPNRYNPSQSSIFRDWRREGHGITDIRHAIADSVNTFFYAIGGGYQDQEGLGITRIEEYVRAFKLAEPTGIDFGNESEGTIPTPVWKEQIFEDGTWRLGDTYNTSIGQFGFQVTPIQMTRAMAALANKGTLVTPILLQGNSAQKEGLSMTISDADYELVHAALRDTVTKGTAQIINTDATSFTAKTGTAQVGIDNEYFNSWVTGFFPYENPKYAFSVVMERAPEDSEGSAGRAMKSFIDQVTEHYPEFWQQF